MIKVVIKFHHIQKYQIYGPEDHEIEKVESKNNDGQICLRDSSANSEESPIKLRKLYRKKF